MAVLEKRAGLRVSSCDAYINIAGGIRMNEPALDLGIVLAVASSMKDTPIDEKTIAFGEVGLSGEVRSVTMPEQRVREAKKLGFDTVILPMTLYETGSASGWYSSDRCAQCTRGNSGDSVTELTRIARFVLRVGIISNFLKKQLTHKAEYGINIECSADIGDWSSGMTGVSKTLSGSSILSSPAHIKSKSL